MQALKDVIVGLPHFKPMAWNLMIMSSVCRNFLNTVTTQGSETSAASDGEASEAIQVRNMCMCVYIYIYI